MSSTFSAESAVSPSDLNEPECVPSRSARSSRSPAPFSESTGLPSPAMTTCEPLPPIASAQMELLPMSSAAGFPAKTSARPAEALELMARAAVCGASTPALLANFDLPTSSWRTSQHCLVEGLTVFSETWPRSGTMRSGIAYQLPPLARATDATESGLLPTPDTGLSPNGHGRRGGRPNNGHQSGLSSSAMAKHGLWATPQARDYMPAHTPEYVAAKRAQGHGMRNLNDEVMMWPTPNAGDYKAGMSNAPGRQQSSLPRSVGIAEGTSSGRRGGLNPTWVEWLMGFPMGWTALKDSATQSSRKSRKSSGEQS